MYIYIFLPNPIYIYIYRSVMITEKYLLIQARSTQTCTKRLKSMHNSVFAGAPRNQHTKTSKRQWEGSVSSMTQRKSSLSSWFVKHVFLCVSCGVIALFFLLASAGTLLCVCFFFVALQPVDQWKSVKLLAGMFIALCDQKLYLLGTLNSIRQKSCVNPSYCILFIY